MMYTVREPEDTVSTVKSLLRRHLDRRKEKNVLLSGGRSIRPVLRAFDEYTSESGGVRCRFFLADERMEGERNQTMLRKRLFDRLIENGTVTEERLRFPNLSLEPHEAADAYERELLPLDVAFLGVGEDGHVASLFPGHPVLSSGRRVDTVYDSPKPPSVRITCTYRVFERRTVVVLLFLGTEKREAFRLFSETEDYHVCPAVYFHQHPQLATIVDRRLTE